MPELRDALRSVDAAVRLAAAERLGDDYRGRDGLPSQAAVPELLTVFAAADEAGAEMAALTLHSIGTWPLGALDQVAARLDSWEVGGAPATTVADLRTALRQPAKAWTAGAIVPHLATLLQVPGCAADALGVLAMLGPDAAPATAAIDAQLIGAEAGVRWRAAFALAQIGAANAPSLRAGLEDECQAVRFWSLRAMLADGRSARPFAAVALPWLEDARVPVQRWAIRVAGTLGSAAVGSAPRLVDLLATHATFGEALAALEQLGGHAVTAVPRLVALLDSPAEHTRAAARAILGAIGPVAGAASERLLEIVTAPVSTDPVTMQPTENEVLGAVTALAKIAPDRAVAALLPGFEAGANEESFGTWHLVTRFRWLGPAAVAVLPRLRELLAGDERNGKLCALIVIEGIGERAASALPDVVPALSHADPHVRRMAVRAIVAMGPPAATAVPALEREYERATGRWRADLVWEVGRLGVAAEPLLVRALQADEPYIHNDAGRQLLQLPRLSETGIAAVLAALDRADSEVVRWLDQSPSLRAQAHGELVKRLGQADAWTVTMLWRMTARTVDDPRWRLSHASLDQLLTSWGFAGRPADAMQVFRDAETMAAWARTFVATEHPYDRAVAAEVLGLLPFSVASLTALRTLAVDPDAGVRRNAVYAIGRFGPAANAALGDLGQALDDGDWFVRAGAATALRAVHASR